jgi:hypothetical protein
MILVHLFGALRVLIDEDTGRVQGVESAVPTVPVTAFSAAYLAAAVRDAEHRVASLRDF